MNITRAKNFLAGIMVAASMVALSACSTTIPEQDAQPQGRRRRLPEDS